MDLERAALKGKLAEAEQRFEKLNNKALGACDYIRTKLDRDFAPVLEMEIAGSVEMMETLRDTYAELLGLRTEIERLKKRLE